MKRTAVHRMTVMPSSNAFNFGAVNEDEPFNLPLNSVEQFVHNQREETKQDFNDSDLENLSKHLQLRRKTRFEEIESATDSVWAKCAKRLAAFARTLCRRIISSTIFETFIMLVITVNVLTLIAGDIDRVQTIDLVFLYIYTAEATLKIIGLGFIRSKDAYLRDNWNILDFTIVITAWVEYFLQEGVNLSILRTLRVLRPLRSISSIEGLKLLLLALFKSFREIVVFLIVLMFFLLITAIASLHMFMGVLRYRCVNVNTGEVQEDLICGDFTCPESYECAETLDNPNYGITNFDDVFYSLFAVFQSITAESWYTIMIYVQKAFSYYVFLFFIPLVFISTFLILNLILAVIKTAFIEAIEKDNEEAVNIEEIEEEKSEESSSESNSQDESLEFISILNNHKGQYTELNSTNLATSTHVSLPIHYIKSEIYRRQNNKEIMSDDLKQFVVEVPESIVKSSSADDIFLEKLSKNVVKLYHDQGNLYQIFIYLTTRTYSKTAFKIVQEYIETTDDDPFTEGHEIKEHFRIWPKGKMGSWKKLVFPLRCFINSSFFSYFMITCVILNTIVLASDRYGINDTEEEVIYILNSIFTFIFLTELIIKMVGLGPLEYFRDPMNYLDFLIVVISIIEFFLLNQNSLASAFRVIRIFRAFRVFRVARLFRYMKSMIKIIKAINKSISKIWYLFLLLMLIMIIFTLLGMQLFGGKFEFSDGKPRAHFDNFLWAFVSVFQIMSIENWPEIAYNGMRSEAGPVSCLFFISWIFIGNFVLLNLFLAILIDSFAESDSNIQPESTIKKKEQIIEELNSEPKTEIVDMNSNSFFIFSATGLTRRFCGNIANSKHFENFILLVIILSSLKLVFDTYIIDEPSDSDLQIASSLMDLVFTCIFFTEFAIKSLASGFVLSKNSYLRDHWNKLDFCIVAISVFELIFTDVDISFIKVLRALRTLRPLRFISQNLSMKVVVVALFESLISLFNVIIVVLVVWLMFAIFGVSLFGGKFYTCENALLKTRSECENYGFDWQNADTNFDNVFNGMLALFIISSLENWPSIMLAAVDSTDVDKAPERDNAEYYVFYFILFILIGTFFFLNLIIAVIFQTFSEAKKNEGSYAALILPSDHLLWVEIQELIVKSKPKIDKDPRPSSRVRQVLYDVSSSQWLDLFIIVIIALNSVQMAIFYYGASAEYIEILEIFNLVFTGIFIAEAMVKIVGLGLGLYFSSVWNRVDFFIVIVSCFDIFITYYLDSDLSILRLGPQLFRILRILRASRLFRLFRALAAVQELFSVLAYSLTPILNVLSLLLLIFFIYAVLGVFLLHDLKKGEVIDDYTNLDNFGMAMILLLRISTGESWDLIMFEAKNQTGMWAQGYFISFVLVTTFIMLNLFVMIILQAYDDSKFNPRSAANEFKTNAQVFNGVWARYASRDAKFIDADNLDGFFDALQEASEEFQYKKFYLSKISIGVENRAYYHDVLYAVLLVKYTKDLKNPTKNLIWKKILSIETQKMKKKLKHLRNSYRNVAIMPIDYSSGVSLLARVFEAWKNHASKREKKKFNTPINTTRLEMIDYD